MKDQPNFLSENGPSPAKKSFDRLTKQPTHFTLLQVDGFPLVSAVSRTLLASQSTHLTKVRYSVLYFAWKFTEERNKPMSTKKKLFVFYMILIVLLFLNIFFFADYIWIERILMIGVISILLIIIFYDKRKD